VRRTGLHTAACAGLCRALLDDGVETISLNVRAYEKPGFVPAADYVEVRPARRSLLRFSPGQQRGAQDDQRRPDGPASPAPHPPTANAVDRPR
jgi:hypothetical protein